MTPGPSPSPDRVRVPAVAGLTLDTARGLIRRAKLDFAAAGRCGDAAEIVESETCVARESQPTAGTRVQEGRRVVVTFAEETSAPDDLVPVPSLAGLTLGEAGRVLEEAGLVLTAVGACDVDTNRPTTSPYCQVASQNLPASERVAKGTNVTATFDWNPPPIEQTGDPEQVVQSSGGRSCADGAVSPAIVVCP